MRNAPFHISIHIGDYLRKTPGLGPGTWEHHGIYCQLRFAAWNTPGCRLPTDHMWIAKNLGCTLEMFKEKVLPVLERQFVRRRNWWYDDDLSTIYKRSVQFSENQSKRASSGKTKEKNLPAASLSLLPSKKEQQHRKIDSDVEKKKPSRRWMNSIRSDEEA